MYSLRNNDSGSTLAGNLIFHPFLWTKTGPMRDPGRFGADCGIASAIDDTGDVVGEADTPLGCTKLLGKEAEYHAFLWKKGVMTDLGTLEGNRCSGVGSINSKGQIVGASLQGWVNFVQYAFLREDGEMVDLNTLIPPDSSLQLAAVEEINDRGEILGDGVPAGCFYIGLWHAFL